MLRSVRRVVLKFISHTCTENSSTPFRFPVTATSGGDLDEEKKPRSAFNYFAFGFQGKLREAAAAMTLTDSDVPVRKSGVHLNLI